MTTPVRTPLRILVARGWASLRSASADALFERGLRIFIAGAEAKLENNAK
ncbi:hypothetical protein [Burkholderia sp. BDU5]|nr:hypothetical protein [Burkholderia sp. BDU5]